MKILVDFFTPVQANNKFSMLPALYLSPLFCNKQIAVIDPSGVDVDGYQGCICKNNTTTFTTTALKILTYVLSLGILPLLAIVLNSVIRCGSKYYYITETSTLNVEHLSPDAINKAMQVDRPAFAAAPAPLPLPAARPAFAAAPAPLPFSAATPAFVAAPAPVPPPTAFEKIERICQSAKRELATKSCSSIPVGKYIDADEKRRLTTRLNREFGERYKISFDYGQFHQEPPCVEITLKH